MRLVSCDFVAEFVVLQVRDRLALVITDVVLY